MAIKPDCWGKFGPIEGATDGAFVLRLTRLETDESIAIIVTPAEMVDMIGKLDDDPNAELSIFAERLEGEGQGVRVAVTADTVRGMAAEMGVLSLSPTVH